MRVWIEDFVKICAETLPIIEPIYEFGSLQVPGQEGFADLRPIFAGKEYLGCDMRKGVGVDRILNLHSIELPPQSVGTVLLLDTLEHVEFVRRAVEEVYRIIKPNGIVVVSSSMKFPIHSHPCDYWRFTPEAFKSLLNPFNFSFVGFAGNKSFPHTVVGVGFKRDMSEGQISDFTAKFQLWKKRWRRPPTELRQIFVKLVTRRLSLKDLCERFSVKYLP